MGGLTIPLRKKTSMLRNVTRGCGIGRVIWDDLSNGKWTRGLRPGMSGVRFFEKQKEQKTQILGK
jgi:hypothetical protein